MMGQFDERQSDVEWGRQLRFSVVLFQIVNIDLSDW